MNPIYCIGDSHVSFFSGENAMPPAWPQRSDDRLPFFKTFRLGPVLAYNLCESGTTTGGREKLFEVLETAVPVGSRVLFVFGEIDCRAHLIWQSQKQKRPVADLVEECVERYLSVVLEVRELDYHPLLWNAVPTTMINRSTEEFPTVGTPQERNRVTRLFNQGLQRCCAEQDIPFVSIFDQLVSETNETDMTYLMDVIHLSQRAMPLAIAELKKHVPEMDFDTFDWETPYYAYPLKRHKLAIITPSYIGSYKRADFAGRSLASLNQALGQQYTHVVVDDVPHFKGRIIHRLPDFRFSRLAEQIYQGEKIVLFRQHGRSSVAATLRAVREASNRGRSLVFLHLDDNVYLPIMRDLMTYAVDAFQRLPDLQTIRLTGLPILSRESAKSGNQTLMTIRNDMVNFENLSLQAQRFDEYTLWWSPFHERLMDGRYYAIPMWFTIYRTDFLEKLLTLNDTVASLRGLGQVELYYKNNWREVLPQIEGKLGYINMQFGGLEMQRNKNWQELINLPNEPVL